MLTCNDITTHIQALGMPITRENYRAIAERIHPLTVRAVVGAIDYDPRDYPEWREYRKGSQYNTTDWTDMVVACVTSWQWSARVARIAEEQHFHFRPARDD